MPAVEPKVNLVNYTQNARDLLIYTKNIRLMKDISNTAEIEAWSEEKKAAELDYMLKTIKSSWEFVDYTFAIQGVSRAFTHQLVRTREACYAQQSQRTVNMEGFDYVIPDKIKKDPEVQKEFENHMDSVANEYSFFIDGDIPPQDARAILPTNVATNIVAKFNLRTLAAMAEKRLCTRTQGEYQKVFKMMRQEIIKVHPWAEKFIRVYCGINGTCQFPNYKECPLKNMCYNPQTGKAWDEKRTEPAHPDAIQSACDKLQFEATPKWKGNS